MSTISKVAGHDTYELRIQILPYFIDARSIKKIWAILIENKELLIPRKGPVSLSWNIAYDHIAIEHTRRSALETLRPLIEAVIEQEKTIGPLMNSNERPGWFHEAYNIYRELNRNGLELLEGKVDLETFYSSLLTK